MSKHLGNILEPIPLMDQHGADAVRWFMAAAGSPWAARRVGHSAHPGGRPQGAADLLEHRGVPGALRPDRRLGARRRPTRRRPTGRCSTAGLLSELHRLVARRRRGAGGLRHPAGRPAAVGVRRRPVQLVRAPLAAAGSGTATRPRCATLHECLRRVTRLMAPLTPFITERVWQDLFAPVDARTLPESVHLAAWPGRRRGADRRRRWPTQMALVRRLVELGRSARAESKVQDPPAAGPGARRVGRDRGPVRRAARARSPTSSTSARSSRCPSAGADLVDVTGEGQLPRARQAVRQADAQVVAAAIAAADAAALAAALRESGRRRSTSTASRRGGRPDEVHRHRDAARGLGGGQRARARPSRSTSTSPRSCARAGLAREVVRLVQEARKTTGFEVADRIALWLTLDRRRAGRGPRRARREIAGEVLAVELAQSAPSESADVATGTEEDLQLTYWLTKA